MRNILLATAAFAAGDMLVPTAARAEAAPSVEELVVTATRLPSTPDVVTGARAIDRAEIEARGAAFVTDILSTLPGVGVARQGGFGGLSAIRLRGASPDKTLVLIDGLPVGDPTDPSGAFDAGALLADDFERIEVLSGPQGSLWGSEAIGGVVSLTTRRLDGVKVSAEGGSYATFRGAASAGVAREAYSLSAIVSGLRTDGFSKADTGAEDDGERAFAASLAARFKVSDRVGFTARLRHTRARTEIDGFAPPAFVLGDTPDHTTSHAWQGDFSAQAEALGFSHEASFGLYDLTRNNVSAFPSRYEAQRRMLRWTAAKADRLVVGAERQETSADLDSGARLNLSNTAVFGVGRLEVGPLTFTASGRYDDPEAFKAKATGRLAAAARLGGGLTATASAGTGFKTPTISQAVCDFCFTPAVPLRPEAARGYDLRLGWTGERASVAITAYRLRVKDQIAYVAGRYTNIARAASDGLEAEAQVRLTEALRLRMAYARLDAVDRSNGASLLRNPDHSGSAALFWDGQRWGGALTVRAESSQTDTARNGFSRVRRGGFVTADLAGRYRLNDKITLTGRVENLADKRYSETFGYREAGLSAYVGFRLTP